MVSIAAKILCFVDVEIEEIIYGDICEYGHLRLYQVILLTSVKDLASIFIFSEPLFQVWIPFKGCCQAAVINYIWTEGEKSKRGSLDACLKTSFILMFERKKPKRRKNCAFITGSHSSGRNGGVGFHIWEANGDIVSDIVFLPYIAWLLFYSGSCSLQTELPPLSPRRAIGMGKRGAVIRSRYELSTLATGW